MDQEGVRKGNGSPKADNKSSQTSQKGEGTGREWLSFLENLEVFQTKHWQRARWGKRSSRKKLPSRSLLQVELKVKMLVALSCLTLCNPMNCSQPGSLFFPVEWVAISFSRGSSKPRNWTQVSCIAGVFFTIWATRGALKIHVSY